MQKGLEPGAAIHPAMVAAKAGFDLSRRSDKQGVIWPLEPNPNQGCHAKYDKAALATSPHLLAWTY